MTAVYAPFATYTKFQEHWDKDVFSLARDAYDNLITLAGNRFKVDAVVLSSMLSQSTSDQSQIASVIARMLGHSSPSFRSESACASGGVAINIGAALIRSGEFRNVLVLGVEKMTDHNPNDIAKMLATANYEDLFPSNITFPALYALYARNWMHKGYIEKHDLFHIAAKNHKNATSNPKAQFRFEINETNYHKAAMIADPLNLLDCSPITDGASALLLSSDIKSGLRLKAISQSTGPISPSFADDLIGLVATREAARSAFNASTLSAKELSVIELHDCFTIAEAMAYVDIGLTPLRQLHRFIISERISTINPSGGLKACGHPIGATGIKQVASLLETLQQREYGLAHNVGGTGQTAVVSIWEKL